MFITAPNNAINVNVTLKNKYIKKRSRNPPIGPEDLRVTAKHRKQGNSGYINVDTVH